MSDPRRLVPRTDAVLADPRLVAAAERLGRARVKQAVVEQQERARSGQITPDSVADAAVAALPAHASSMQAVLNATGVVLHTNLGRAPLSAAARDALAAAAGYVDVEYDVTTGQRAPRGRGRVGRAAPGRPRCRGRPDRQQRRGRSRAGHDGVRRWPRGDHQPGRDGRDRRRFPAAGADRVDGRAVARGRDDQSRHAGRLRRCDQRRHRVHPQGASQQLPSRRVHVVGVGRRAGGPARAGGSRCR